MNNKKTIFIIGVGPMPIENTDKIYAPGLRLLTFAEEIYKTGCRVIIGEAKFGDKHDQSLSPAKSGKTEIKKDLIRRVISLSPSKAAQTISSWINEEKPAAIVSSTDVMILASAMIKTDVPRWMDYNGHPMVERQEISYVNKNDSGLIDQWKYVVPGLLAGDFFSTCSTPQKHALMGELGAVGRLNSFTAGNDFVSVIPPGYCFHEKKTNIRKIMKGIEIPEDSFSLLWTGGFNTWVDEVTLFHGVDKAMDRNPKVHFVLTGGAIQGHNESTFGNFKKLVEKSRNKKNYHFRGWVDLEDLSSYYSESDAGINIDRFTYEAVLGFRNRIMSWMEFKVPVITTPVSEITLNLVNNGMAAGFPPGDSEKLADLLCDMAANKQKYEVMTEKAYKHLHEELTNEKLLAPLLKWIEKPERAPDRLQGRTRAVTTPLFGEIEIPENSLAYNSLKNLELLEIENELKSIKNSRLFKLRSFIRKMK